jgi:transcriptional regulator with XRE-family HTH domain
MNVGLRIAMWRKWKGWTQHQLADAVEFTNAAVYQWETGRTTPSLESLQKIVDALGISMERFYGRVPKAKAA